MGGGRFPGPTIREVCSPMIEEDLAPLLPEHTTVQISSRLTDGEFRRLADFMADYPDVRLRVYGGYDGSIKDLDFLRFFPRLRRFSVDAIYDLSRLDGIGLLSEELEDLLIGWTRSKRFSLRTLTKFGNLRKLYLEGQQKDIGAIGELSALDDLTLRSITLPDLSALLPLRKLTSLDIKLGGTRNVGLLPKIGRLTYVELWRVRGLEDVSALAEIESLERFFLQTLKGVTSLPSLARSDNLRSVALETMTGITDLAPIAKAPKLERLVLVEMCQLEPEALRPFIGHPTLRDGTWGLCSDRKNIAAWDLLPLGDPPFNHPKSRAPNRFRQPRAPSG
jgi:hypothetical protein